LYNDGELYYFMDLETYEQPAIPARILGDAAGFLTENMEVKLTFYQGEPLDVELPTSVDLEVVQADASVRGDTATGVTKKVKTQTGLEVTVPGFVEVGNVIRVDTRTGSYVTRV
jgi:elongation factor P